VRTIRTATIVVSIVALFLMYLAFRARPDPTPGRLPGAAVFEASQRLGWRCRPDPQRDFGEGFYFYRQRPPTMVRLLNPQATDDWTGLVRAQWLPDSVVRGADGELEGLVRRVGGWELRGDLEMLEDLARELTR
jgi:hypothetical protein